MAFIEMLLGVSPDGGDGTTELIYLTLIAVVAAAFVYARRRTGKPRAS